MVGATPAGVMIVFSELFGLTFGDWLSILLVPVVLAGLGGLGRLFITWLKRRDLEVEKQRLENEQALEQQRAQDEVFQAYLNQMSQPLIDRELYKAGRYDAVRVLARARTIGVLWKLDAYRKRSLMQFLHEARLIRRKELPDRVSPEPAPSAPGVDQDREEDQKFVENPVIGLSSADLIESFLKWINLSKADLTGADLKRANLGEADLRSVDLRGVDLEGADLRGALLSKAEDLEDADLEVKGADLRKANLKDADLSNANLSDANLSDANLEDATGWNKEQLKQAESLEGATMPTGQILKSKDNPDGSTPEEWLESHGKETSGPP
jgi:hypothetical protein